jgi:hypothetical protein
MPASFLEESVAVLARTPAALDALLPNLPELDYRHSKGPPGD